MRFFLHLLLLTTTCLWTQLLFAQPDTLWSRRIVGSPAPTLYGAVELSNGDYLFVGESNHGSPSLNNMYICRMSATGAFLWSHAYGGSGEDIAYGAVELPNGNFIINGWGNNRTCVRLMGISATGDSLWSRSYVPGGITESNGIALLRDGNIAVTGYRLESGAQYFDMWVLKCTTNGDTLWTRLFGRTQQDKGCRIVELPDSSLLIGGQSADSTSRLYDLWLVRVSTNGTLISHTAAPAPGVEYCYGICQDDTIAYLCGSSNVTGSVNHAYLAKYSLSGQARWNRTYSTGNSEEQTRGIVMMPGGGAMMAGWSGGSSVSKRCWLLSVDWAGNELWNWSFGNTGSGFNGLIPLSTGGHLAFGDVTEDGQRSAYLLRLRRPTGINGTVRESSAGLPAADVHVSVIGQTYRTITDQQGHFSLQIPSGVYDLAFTSACLTADTLRGIVVAPDVYSTVSAELGRPIQISLPSSINLITQNEVPTSFPFVLKNTGTGELTFSASVETVHPTSDWLQISPLQGAVQPHDSAIIQIQVHTDTLNEGIYDFFALLHLRTNACPDSIHVLPVLVAVLDAEDHPSLIPLSYSLSAYPNPFNPSTTIAISLPEAAQTKLEVFSITGQIVATLTNTLLAAGEHRFQFDAHALPSGIYFAHLESEKFTTTKKIVLLK